MRYKNGMLSAVFGIMQQILTLIFGLIVPRIFIQTFGSEMNGFLSSLGNIYSYLALVEAGVGTAAIQALYGPLGRDDKHSVNEIMAAIAKYYNRAGVVYLLGVVVISIGYPLTVNTTIPFGTIFIVTILSGMGGVINFWIQGKYMVLLQAEGKKYLMSIVTMIVYVTQNVIKIVLLLKGFDVIAIHIGYFIISLSQMLFYLVYIKQNYKWIDFSVFPRIEALNQSGAVFVQQITGMICSNTDILVLTYVLKDLKAVSVYSVYFMIYSAVERLFSTLFGSFHYIFGQKYNTDRDGYMRLHPIYEGLSMTGSFALYTVAFLLTTPFMKIYTAGIGDVAYVDKYLPFLFAFVHIFSSSREACARVINFAGHFKQMQWRAVLESVINIVVSCLLVRKIGIYGVLIGTLVAYLYRTTDIILYANKYLLERSCWKTYKIWLTNIVAFIFICFLFQHVDLTVGSFGEFLILGICCGGTIFLIYCLKMYLFEKQVLIYLIQMIKKIGRKS